MSPSFGRHLPMHFMMANPILNLWVLYLFSFKSYWGITFWPLVWGTSRPDGQSKHAKSNSPDWGEFESIAIFCLSCVWRPQKRGFWVKIGVNLVIQPNFWPSFPGEVAIWACSPRWKVKVEGSLERAPKMTTTQVSFMSTQSLPLEIMAFKGPLIWLQEDLFWTS